MPVRLAGVVDIDDVRVVDGGGETPLPLETVAEVPVLDELWQEHLQRPHSVQTLVTRSVDDAHASATEDSLDAVPAERAANQRVVDHPPSMVDLGPRRKCRSRRV